MSNKVLVRLAIDSLKAESLFNNIIKNTKWYNALFGDCKVSLDKSGLLTVINPEAGIIELIDFTQAVHEFAKSDYRLIYPGVIYLFVMTENKGRKLCIYNHPHVTTPIIT